MADPLASGGHWPPGAGLQLGIGMVTMYASNRRVDVAVPVIVMQTSRFKLAPLYRTPRDHDDPLLEDISR